MIWMIRNFIGYNIILIGEGVAILGFMLLSSDEKVSFSKTAVKSINDVFRRLGA